jgi:hypothetical protein
LIGPTCEATHAKAGHGIAWQLVALSLRQLLAINLSCAEGVVAKDQSGLCRVREHIGSADAAAAVLLGESLDVLIQRRHAAQEPLPIMNGRVERQFFKHV